MTPKILVVDDEPDLQTLIQAKFRKSIKNNEFEFFFAKNGAEALNQLENDTDLNIILTDINMPVMDGLTLLTSMNKLNRLYRAIVVSAYGDLSNIRSAMNRGASDFVMKPIDFQDFETTLRRIIDEYNKLKEASHAQALLLDIQKELDVARIIQEAMLPKEGNPFQNHKLEIAGRMIPAKEVGGDCYDFFPLDDNKLAIFIADVSGKSISACLYMVLAKSLLRALAHKQNSLVEVITQINELLTADNKSSMFVTGFYGMLELDTGILRYCNAGHNPPLLLSSGKVTPLPCESSVAMGVSYPLILPYKEEQIQLKDRDILLLFTDGVNNAINIKQEQYGEKRLESYLNSNSQLECNRLVDGVVEELKKFSEGAPQSDDITLLGIRYLR